METLSLNEFIQRSKEDISQGYYLAFLTDVFTMGDVDEIENNLCGKEKKVLEIRAFNSEKEYKLLKASTNKDGFVFRAISDFEDNSEEKEYYDEEQILDIDMRKSHFPNVVTTGGGKISMPESFGGFKSTVIIRYYLEKYAETGQARVSDWRIVGFK